jgi:lysyl-tRNA synthetase class 2
LWLLRDHFHSQVDAGAAWRRTSALLLLTLGIAIGAVAVAEGWALAHHRGVLSAGDVFGLHWSELHKPERVLIFITALGVSAVLGYVLTTPRLRPLREGDSDVRAHAVVSAYSDDSLSYFALRDDKQHFATEDGLVAYRLVGGVCLVSPDPIGANPQTVWREFRNFAEHNGWPVAVVAANEQWAQTYGAEGCITIYMGDEAVVDVNSFSLEGRENRGLRQAVNRMKRYGYTVEMTTVGSIGAETRRMLRDISVENRLGAAERGFAMALGRIASSRDPELLLAICRNPEGEICGFSQLVPAPGIDGWSLDVMRRDRGEHPNGMVDYLVTETIDYVRTQGQSHVSLNFATLRSFVQGEDLAIRGLRGAILRFLVRNAPMDTLYRFNAKFQPTWVPRFLCMDGTEYLVPVIFAIVEAEGLFEVPILGRLLVKTQKAPMSTVRC